jgi:peptidoglycan/LPS O-acetylase OafA/YrhL
MNTRSAYLDGLRGFAAAQVILLHYFTAFIPVLAFPTPYQGWHSFVGIMGGTPLYYFFDGNSAIDTFFLLSGYVLTLSYLKKTAKPWRLVLARTLRLGIPVSCSLVLAWILFAIFPNQHREAGAIAQSSWLSHLCDVQFHSVDHLKEIFYSSMFIGYGDSSFWYFFPAIYKVVKPPGSGQSLNFPLWTLSMEFYGSLLILLICVTYRKIKVLYPSIVILMIAYFQPFSIALFFIGHLFAFAEFRFPATKPFPKTVSLVGSILCWPLIGLAIWLSSRGIPSPWLATYFSRVPTNLIEKMIGAILIFASVLFFKRAGVFGRPLIALFETPFFQFLGHRSFAVYLIHIPILFTMSSYAYIFLSKFENKSVATLLTIFWGIFFTYLVSGFFEKYIDRYALAISRARSAKPCTTE